MLPRAPAISFERPDKLMLSSHFAEQICRRGKKRIIRWLMVALYTAALPFVILVFRAIEQYFSLQTAGRIPLLITFVLVAGYTLVCISRHKAAAQCIIILTAGALIVFGILSFEDNANKYIHIPEYIIMTWFLYLDQIALNNHTTAMLWVICPLVILLCMHALVVLVAVTGINFR